MDVVKATVIFCLIFLASSTSAQQGEPVTQAQRLYHPGLGEGIKLSDKKYFSEIPEIVNPSAFGDDTTTPEPSVKGFCEKYGALYNDCQLLLNKE